MSNIFQPTNPEVALLVELAMEVATEDPIEWADLNISEQEAYAMMATYVSEMKNDHLTDKAVIVKLLVENFTLNLRLLGKK